MSGLEPYGLTDAMQGCVAYLACTDADFFGRFASYLDATRFPPGPAQQLVKASLAIQTPGQPMLVLQRLHEWYQDGKLRGQEVQACGALIERMADGARPPADEVVRHLVPCIQRALDQEIAIQSSDDYSAAGGFDRTARLIERRNAIGRVDQRPAMGVDQAAADAIQRANTTERLSTGVTALDLQLDGGLRRRKLGAWCAPTGGGKSIALVHQAVEACMQGRHTLYCTNELEEADVMSRYCANMVGRPIHLIEREPHRWVQHAATLARGRFVCRYFPAGLPFGVMARWAEQEAKQHGPVEVLLVDYADQLGCSERGVKADDDYHAGKYVYTELRNWAREHDAWVWTASQAKRREGKKRALDVDDVADSIHKARLVDVFVSVVVDQDQMLQMRVGKHRQGAGQETLPAFPHDFACGSLIARGMR